MRHSRPFVAMFALMAAIVGEWWLHRTMHQAGWQIRP